MSPAETAAHRMGHMAGQKHCETGVPSPNHLDRKGLPHLAAAWRRGYMSAHAEHRTGGAR